MLISVSGRPHPLVWACLVCLDDHGRRISGIYSFDTTSSTATLLYGGTAAVASWTFDVATVKDAEKLKRELPEEFHVKVTVVNGGVHFFHSF